VVEEVAVQCSTAGWGCIQCKKTLHEQMETELVPIRRRAEELRDAPERITAALEVGAERCRAIASETMREVKAAMGIG
jgi:tryptophanyl-tRNA synthetase